MTCGLLCLSYIMYFGNKVYLKVQTGHNPSAEGLRSCKRCSFSQVFWWLMFQKALSLALFHSIIQNHPELTIKVKGGVSQYKFNIQHTLKVEKKLFTLVMRFRYYNQFCAGKDSVIISSHTCLWVLTFTFSFFSIL